jgi:glutathione S-transferase
MPREDAMLVIWGRANSVNVQKVLWCCEELRVPYERKDAGMAFGVVNTPEYRALNPNGLVPTIVDDGFVMWESNAIVRYLARKHGTGSLAPSDPRWLAMADQWMDWLSSTLWPGLRPLFWGLVRTPPEKRDNAAIEAARQQSAAACTILDAQLASRAYVAGDAFTMADIVLGTAIWRWYGVQAERPPLGHLQRWFDRLSERPAYVRIVRQPLT